VMTPRPRTVSMLLGTAAAVPSNNETVRGRGVITVRASRASHASAEGGQAQGKQAHDKPRYPNRTMHRLHGDLVWVERRSTYRRHLAERRLRSVSANLWSDGVVWSADAVYWEHTWE
jgi:hypothetical protein